MESTIHLSEPPIYNHRKYESNALYYRSNVDNKEYIVLIQSRSPNERVCKYDIENDEYIPISPHRQRQDCYSFPFKSPKLAQIISNNNNNNNNDQLLTMCTDKNQLAALNLNTSNYINNYQSTYNHTNTHNISSSSSYILQLIMLMVVLSIFLCHNSISIAATYGFLFYFISTKIAGFAYKFEKDIKCVIPDFEFLYNISSCSVDGDGIHFIANNYKHRQSILNHIKFDVKSRQFIKLKCIDFEKDLNDNNNKNNEEYEEETATLKTETIKAYKMVYIEFIETLIMFTNTENIYYYDLKDEEGSKWRMYEDVKLPKVPSNEYAMNVVVGFKGIIFLFYYEKDENGITRIPSEESDSDTDCDEEEEVFTYCWDLLFTGNMFECDNKYPSFNNNNNNAHCIAINTDRNWTHFIGENPLPFHFKISLTEQIPFELTIIHLQYFHSLIKQYILTSINHKIPTDVEMLVLDYFPMFF